MYTVCNKKALNMLILSILEKYSDEDHKLTQQEIMRLLRSEYNVDCDRRTVKNNVISLNLIGYKIPMDGGYYLAEREFDDDELLLLIKGVLFSDQLTGNQSSQLIDKLCKKGSRTFRMEVDGCI